MEKTMTVQGAAKISVRPDQTVLTLTVESKHHTYAQTMTRAAEAVERLNQAFEAVGFPKDAFTTANFQVRTDYENSRDEQGNYKNVFVGYCCDQTMQLKFACDSAKLAAALTAVTDSEVNPRVGIEFTVCDADAAKHELLRQATMNATSTAKTLAAAADVALGALIAIEYGFAGLNLVSPTRFETDARCRMMSAAVPNVAPQDIELTDTVKFVWAIEASR